MNIIFMGMKHCGKTSVGKKIARELNHPFFDLDDLVVEQYRVQYGHKKGVEDIFREEGASIFYRIEAYTFNHFSKHEAQLHEEFVLSLGGRTPLNPLLGKSLEQCGYCIYINTPFESIRDRIMKKGTSVLVQNNNPVQYLKELYDIRHPVYSKRAHWCIDGGGTVDEITKRILIQIKELQHGGK
ncbi:MAG: hypothetical protein JW904_06055 [Spirochaetales bacterium]|nr:hypothetical protein [Spirochaetales bacterium]